MRKSIVLVAFALVFAVATALASQTPQGEPQPDASDKTTACERLRLQGANPTQLAQEGCCLNQGGVCGCEYGQILCCDGQYDATCEC